MTAGLSDIPAVQEMAALGARFVCWKIVVDKKTGKDRKMPVQVDGTAASSTNPATWNTLDACVAAASLRKRWKGVGFVFNGADGIGGADLDGCRNAETGKIDDWARELIDAFGSYTEVSPSGTGVKIWARGSPLPTLTSHKLSMGEPVEGGKDPAIEAYTTGRYFALTGQHLDGTPDTIEDATEAWERLAWRMAQAAAVESGDSPQPSGMAVVVDHAGLPAALGDLIQADEEIRETWTTGKKLTKGGDRTSSGLEFSLMVRLAMKGCDDELIEQALRLYPFGQVRELNPGNATRRVERLLKKAAGIREKAERRQGAAAWYGELVMSEQGPRDCLANGAIILRRDPAFGGRLAFDEHRGVAICRSLPWHLAGDAREWSSTDDLRFAEWCQVRDVPLKPATAADAAAVVASDHPYHPPREWLDGLIWDGTRRIDIWLERCLGASATGEGDDLAANAAYLGEVGRRWLISGVARIFKPGCKADHALVLEGPQGVGKSSALAALVPTQEWFADEISDLGSKDSAQDLRGKWIIELAELSALRRGEVERVKAFISRSVDHYRPSYGRRSQDFPRQCVFAGTTNADAYLADETGGRRFWPVKVGKIDLAKLREHRDQLWAEAVMAFKAGEIWWLPPEIEKTAATEQTDRCVTDPWENDVLRWANLKIGRIKIEDVLTECIQMDADKRDQAAQNRVARILRAAGYKRARVTEGSNRPWVYSKVSQSADEVSQSCPSTLAATTPRGPGPVPVVPVVPVDSCNVVVTDPPVGGGWGVVGIPYRPPESHTGTGTTGTPPLATCTMCRKPARILKVYCGPCEDECAAKGVRF